MQVSRTKCAATYYLFTNCITAHSTI